MTASNDLRFKVKPGREQAFLNAHRKECVFGGMREAHMIRTGERS